MLTAAIEIILAVLQSSFFKEDYFTTIYLHLTFQKELASLYTPDFNAVPVSSRNFTGYFKKPGSGRIWRTYQSLDLRSVFFCKIAGKALIGHIVNRRFYTSSFYMIFYLVEHSC